MPKTQPSSSKDGTNCAVTGGVLVEKLCFTWKINNFDIVRKLDNLISAQSFEFEAGHSIGQPTTWKLFLENYEHGEQQPKVKWISIHFGLVGMPPHHLRSTCSVGIFCERANGSRYINLNAPFKEMGFGGTLGWNQFIKQDLAVNDLPLVDGALIIKMEFTLYATQKPASVKVLDISTEVKKFEVKANQQLIMDLGKTEAITGSNADSLTKVISKDKMEFPVNRGILSARSLVFQRMFQSDLKEAKTGVDCIDDLSGKTLAVLLQYIMTGRLHEDWNSPEVIMELPYAAHKYELGLLVDFLDQVLGRIGTIGNAKQLAGLANKLGMKKAEEDLLAFVRDKAARIKSLEDLTTLMDTAD